MSKKLQDKEILSKRKNRHLWLSTGILLLGLLVIYVTLLSVAQTSQYDLKVGEVSPQTITATKDVIDTITTQILQTEARDKVQPIILKDSLVSTEVEQSITQIFAAIEEARFTYDSYRDRQEQIALLENPEALPTEILPDATLVAKLRNAIDTVASNLSDSQLTSVMIASAGEYSTFHDNVASMALTVMEEGINEKEMPDKLKELRNNTAFELYGIKDSLRPIANSIFASVIVPNEYIDEQATQKARLDAEATINPITYKKGQNIVREGEVIQENQLSMLSALGLLKDSKNIDLPLFLGVGILLALLGAASYMRMIHDAEKILSSSKNALLIVTIMTISLLASLAARQINVYVMPVHFTLMLIAVLLSPRIALAFNLLMGFTAGMLATGQDGVFSSTMFEMLIISQIGGAIVTFSLRKTQKRTSLLLSGLWTGLVSALTMVAIGLMTNLNFNTTLVHAGYIAIGAALSAVLAVGFLPLLEAIFGMMTQQKLLELSNPNQPLLRLLQVEAPGTYHHSLLVANLAEAAADAVGANALLCRVGAYYHDIGKTKRPIFFKENQMDNVNPHDTMDPNVSAAILAAHLKDGRMLGERAKLPTPILDIISQHHGTTIMAYFYFRAKKMAEDTLEEVAENDFRYDGPNPQTKEAAIIFLADTVEAAVRSLPDHASEHVHAMIHKLINERLQDGQLDDVPLTLADYHQIELVFQRVMSGVYHSRVEYPELDSIKKEEKML